MKIRFIREFFTFAPNSEIVIEQDKFNIIVGNNGAGKSTFLKSLSKDRRKNLIGRYIEIDGMQRQNVLFLNSEGFRNSTSVFVDSRREVYVKGLQRKSHGEAWKFELENLKRKCNDDTFIIMDEPETSLSIESQIELCEWFIDLKNTYQNIGGAIATHSLIIAELIGERVIEVPSCQVRDAESYIKDKQDYIKQAKSKKL